MEKAGSAQTVQTSMAGGGMGVAYLTSFILADFKRNDFPLQFWFGG